MTEEDIKDFSGIFFNNGETEQADYLTCGGCQKNFELANINNFVRHKRFDCDEQNTQQGRRSKILLCKSCPQKFGTPWSLLQHAQNVHALQIYLEQGDFSELSIQTIPAAAKENRPAQFTTHQALAFISKERLPDLNANATPVMIIQGVNGEKQLVRIEKPRPDTSNLTQDQGTVALPTNTLLSQRVAGTQSQQVKSLTSPVPATKFIQSATKTPSALTPPKIKLTPSQTFKTTPVLQQKPVQVVNQNTSSGQSFFAVLPSQPNKTTEKPATVTRASPIVQKISALSTEANATSVKDSATSPVKSSAAEKDVQEDVNSKENNQDPAEGSAREAQEEEPRLCCDNQDCGVTVMPVTHKELEKCCSAVLPKKRKRHMATNHMPSTLRAKRQGEGDKYSVNVPTADRSFVIDIEHHEDTPRATEDQNSSPEKEASKIQESGIHVMKQEEGEGSPQERSVIIQPGASIAIPVSLESFRRLVGSKKSGRIPVRFPGSSPMPISMHVAPISEEKSNAMASVEKDIKPVITPEGQVQAAEEENGEEKQEKIRRGKRRYPTSRPFKCNECEQGFNQRIHLQKHQSKHTGIKPFQCGQCSYSTVEKSHLKVHIRVHTGEKPFKCTYCEYATAQNSTLKIHLRRHHDQNGTTATSTLTLANLGTIEETITSPSAPSSPSMLESASTTCAVCDKECASTEERQRHEQEEHGMETETGQGDVIVEQVPVGNGMELMQVGSRRMDPGNVIAQMIGSIMDQGRNSSDNGDVMTPAQRDSKTDKLDNK